MTSFTVVSCPDSSSNSYVDDAIFEFVSVYEEGNPIPEAALTLPEAPMFFLIKVVEGVTPELMAFQVSNTSLVRQNFMV